MSDFSFQKYNYISRYIAMKDKFEKSQKLKFKCDVLENELINIYFGALEVSNC